MLRISCVTSVPNSLLRLGAFAIALATYVLTIHAACAQEAKNCEPIANIEFICDVNNVEDMIRIGNSAWVIGSSLASPGVTSPMLYLFNASTKAAKPIQAADIRVEPDSRKFPGCAAPDFKIFSSHGLDFRPGDQTLFVVNHGGREAIEIFTVDISGGPPVLSWRGCVIAPAHFWPDAVAALPDGGIVLTSLWATDDDKRVAKLVGGQPVGGLAEWHAGTGWRSIGPANMSGPNGVIAAADGREIFVALWSAGKVLRLNRETGAATEIVAGAVLPDNLRWNEDRTAILMGGVAATVQPIFECFSSSKRDCDLPFAIYKIDPSSLEMSQIVKPGIYGGMGAGTGAIQIGRQIWGTTFRASRIAIFPAP